MKYSVKFDHSIVNHYKVEIESDLLFNEFKEQVEDNPFDFDEVCNATPEEEGEDIFNFKIKEIH